MPKGMSSLFKGIQLLISRRNKEMKNKQRHTHRSIVTILTLILTLLLAKPGAAPAVTAGEASPVREDVRVDQPGAGTTAVAGCEAGEQATILDLIRQAQYQFA
jgi:hypothetical protein